MKKQWLDVLSKSALFKDIAKSGINDAIACFKPEIAYYQKNDTAVFTGDRLKGIGIVLEGRVSIAKETYTGDRIILNVIGRGGMFGEIAAFTEGRLSQAIVIAKENCVIIYISPDNITDRCGDSCEHHRRIEINIIEIISRKAIELIKKIDYMAIKGMRAKICTFLYDRHLQSGGSLQFMLPFNRSEMADYLNVSRPSMSREMCRLRDEGIIEFFSASVRIAYLDGLKKYIV